MLSFWLLKHFTVLGVCLVGYIALWPIGYYIVALKEFMNVVAGMLNGFINYLSLWV